MATRWGYADAGRVQAGPALLLDLPRVEKGVEQYVREYVIQKNRPAERSMEANGRWSMTRPSLSTVTVKTGGETQQAAVEVVAFHETRATTTDADNIVKYRLGNDPGKLFTVPQVQEELRNIKELYVEDERGPISDSDLKETSMPEIAKTLASVRRKLQEKYDGKRLCEGGCQWHVMRTCDS